MYIRLIAGRENELCREQRYAILYTGQWSPSQIVNNRNKIVNSEFGRLARSTSDLVSPENIQYYK